jgi:hypothetical protein
MQMTLTASSLSPDVGSPVTFTVTASNPQVVLLTASIDFTGDGGWDEVQGFGESSIVATFTHTYDGAGGYTVRAKVVDAGNVVTTRSLLVIAGDPPNPPVTYRVTGTSPAGDLAVCEVFGPPAACAGCTAPIGAAGLAGSLGSFAHGTPIAATQAFAQERFVSGTANVKYACSFVLDLYAGTPGNETQFAHGVCSTDSGAVPERLTCSVDTGGTVP